MPCGGRLLLPRHPPINLEVRSLMVTRFLQTAQDRIPLKPEPGAEVAADRGYASRYQSGEASDTVGPLAPP